MSQEERNLEFNDDVFDVEFDSFDDDEDIMLEEDDLDEKGLDSEEANADEFGTDVSFEDAGLLEGEGEEEDSGFVVMKPSNDFISDSGDIVVMEKNDGEDGFEFTYVDIERIGLAKERIRKTQSVGDLYESIKSTGLLEPVDLMPSITDGYYVLVHGYRRLIACGKAGMRRIPCVINKKMSTSEIRITEAIYNIHKRYTMREISDYIEFLEKEAGVNSASMIEYLVQWENGDYNKFKDIIEDGDPDIIGKMMDGFATVQASFKALENRRKKESREEKELKKVAKAYDENADTGADLVSGAGEMGDESSKLTDEELKGLALDPTSLDDDIDDISLDEMVNDGKNMEGFEAHKQDYRDREFLDPAIRKAIMSRDKDTCQCCKRGGPDYVDILDGHHIVEVYLGGEDSVENGIALCLNCHKQVHLYAFNQLHIPRTKTEYELDLEVKKLILEESEKCTQNSNAELSESDKDEIRERHLAIYKEEQNKYKRIVKLGNKIREGIQMKGIKLEQVKKDHPIGKIGRQKPGQKNTIA